MTRRSFLRALVVAAALVALPALARATVTIRPANTVLLTGDSISTAPFWGPTAMNAIDSQFIPDSLGVKYGARGTVTTATVTGAIGTVATSTAPPPTIIRVFTGVSGSTVSLLANNVSTLITSYSPDVIWIHSGVNDVPGNNPTAFSASVTSLLSQLRTWSPTVQILWSGIWMRGEVWAAGPVWDNGADDAVIDSFNGIISAACATYGATYVDNRGPALTYEAAHNPTKADSGIQSTDGIHPNATGITQISNNVVASCQVVQ